MIPASLANWNLSYLGNELAIFIHGLTFDG